MNSLIELHKYAARFALGQGRGGAPAWSEFGRKGRQILGSISNRIFGARNGAAYVDQFGKTIGAPYSAVGLTRAPALPSPQGGMRQIKPDDAKFFAQSGDVLGRSGGLSAENAFRDKLFSGTLPSGPSRDMAMKIENTLYPKFDRGAGQFSEKIRRDLNPGAGRFSDKIDKNKLMEHYQKIVMENLPL